jgi:hypothetical protein
MRPDLVIETPQSSLPSKGMSFLTKNHGSFA